MPPHATLTSPALPFPAYVCAIITRHPFILLESRPASAAKAANKLTCFGGKLEELDETPEDGLKRELVEELGWDVGGAAMEKKVDLYVGGELTAYFYEISAPDPDYCFTFEEGRGISGEWVRQGQWRN